MYNIYQTKDEKFAVLGGAEMHFAEAILTKLGRTDLIEFCAPPPGPNQNPAREFLQETFKTKTLADWLDWFEDVDAAFAPVNDLRKACDDPQIRHRQMIIEDVHGWEHLGIPIKFECEPGQPIFEFATLGQHTDEVLQAIGYDEEMLAAVHKSGNTRP